MSYPKFVSTTAAAAVTTVDCQKQVRSWRLLRSIMLFLIPTCNSSFTKILEDEKQQNKQKPYYAFQNKNIVHINSDITGTIFGHRHGKVSVCIQSSSKSTNPIVLLELAVSTSTLAREMKGGVLRIGFKCNKNNNNNHNDNFLLSTTLWTMYLNGKKVGHAIKRKPSQADTAAFKLLSGVDIGAGVINGKEMASDDELMYLRANFISVSGSSDSESFHLVDPDGIIGQELSIFFFRS